jgi:signal transduction histidine kinase
MWYLCIVMAISLIFSVVLYRVSTNEVRRGIHSETDRIYRQFPVFQGNPLLRPGADSAHASHRIFIRLVGFNVVVLVGAGLSSYWLARRTLRPIEETHDQQKRFTADVSHELRTPLTALRMESEVALMNRKSGAAELRRTITSNLEEVSRLEGLLNSLLRLARLETGELRQNFTIVNGRTVLEAALKQVRPLAEGRGIKLKSNLQDMELPGDPDGLEQLLVILLDNAIKYSPNDSTVTAAAEQVGDNAVFTVTDQGQGIDPAALEHVFDRFYRADASRTKGPSQGHGLGLSIAKTVADLHDGTIDLSSQVGKGTTATVTLPLNAGKSA